MSENEASRRRILEGPIGLGVLRFGAPLVLGMVLHTSFNIVDLYMISRLENGSVALAALGVCDMVAAIATILSNGISTAAVAMISRALGANDLRGVRRAAWQSLWLVVVLSVVFGVVGLFGSDWLVRDVMRTRGEAADIASGYLQIMLGGSYSIFLLLQLVAILRGLGHARGAAALLIGGNALNIVLNVLFIYGSGPAPTVFAWGGPIAGALGIPRMGVEGAAWATLVARSVPVVIGFVWLMRRRGGPKFHWVYVRPFADELRTLIRLGWPASAQLIVRVGAILVILALLNEAYTTADDQSVLTAFAICLRLETMVLFVGMGWGAAAASYVGTSLGAELPRRAVRSGWTAALFNFVMMMGLAAVYVTWVEPIVGFFDPDPRVVAIGAEYLGVVAITYGVFGVGVVLSQALAGAGATLRSLLVDTAVLAIFVLPAAIWVVLVAGWPRDSLWMVVALGNLAGGVAYAIAFGRGAFLASAPRMP